MEKTKHCPKCQTTKPWSAYYLSKRGNHPQAYCIPCHTKYTVERNKSIPKETRAAYTRTSRLRKTYGLERREYDALLQSQGGVCAICKTSSPLGKGPNSWKVDHCHKTGKTRGLLCNRCNCALGQFKDNIESIKRAIEYLEKYAGN